MLQYRTNAGERRKPALGAFGELTVEQARVLAQEWLAEVRRGGDPSADKQAARKAATMKSFATPLWKITPSTEPSLPRNAAIGASSTATSSPSWGQ
jgi:hypothetical protein